MPYIEEAERGRFDETIGVLAREIETSGELNYVFTRIMHDIINRQGLNYTLLNEMVGVLECAKLELYRRIAADYEDTKRQVNGDVHPFS